MNNELIIKKKIEHLELDKAEKNKHLKHLGVLLTASFILTFLLYLAFSLALYVGDVFNLKSLITSFADGGYGLIFFAVISILLAYVLAGVKHAAYIHFSLFRTVKIILALLVFTGIMAEVFNSSGVQDSKARTINSGNAEYNALINSNGSSDIKIDEGLVSRIAYAEKILARCEVKRDLGKEKHCKGDKAKLTALLSSQAALMKAQVQASNSNQSDKFKRLDEIKNDSYNPLIKSIANLFTMSISSAVSLLMLIFAILFESLHYYLSVMRKDTIRAIEGIQGAIDRADIDYLTALEYRQKAAGNPDETLTEISDYPEENRVRWKQSDVTAKKQNYVGFINPNVRPMESKKAATSDTPSNRPAPCTVQGNTGKNTANDTGEKNDYERLKQLIIQREISTTYRPIKAWMKQENIGTSDKNRQDITMEYLDKMHTEGVLKINPENDGRGVKKAKYVLDK